MPPLFLDLPRVLNQESWFSLISVYDYITLGAPGAGAVWGVSVASVRFWVRGGGACCGGLAGVAGPGGGVFWAGASGGLSGGPFLSFFSFSVALWTNATEAGGHSAPKSNTKIPSPDTFSHTGRFGSTPDGLCIPL